MNISDYADPPVNRGRPRTLDEVLDDGAPNMLRFYEAQFAANREWANKVFLAAASESERDRERLYLTWAATKKPPFVYFMRVGPFVKIGTSAKPKQRVIDMQTALPVEPVIVGIMMGGRKVEFRLHDQFIMSRIRGEWFVWSDDIRKHMYLRHCRYFERRLPWCS